jgi:TPR repeat protein
MALLGSVYLLGNGGKEDGCQAVAWLQKAIDGGYEDAVSVLGMAYATGKAGVKVDMQKASAMLQFAADKGDSQSARMLEMMDKGEGMFRSLKKRR